MASENIKSAKTRKVIDVTEPGTSEPSATARPIIVTNRPVLKRDPMVMSDEPSPPVQDETPKVSRSIKVIPYNAEQKEEKETSPTKTNPEPKNSDVSVVSVSVKKADTPPAVAEMQDPLEEASGPPAIPDKAADETVKGSSEPVTHLGTAPTTEEPEAVGKDEDNQRSPSVDETTLESTETDEQLAPNKIIAEAKTKEDEKKAAQLAEQEQLIGSKKYFLPINAVEIRQGKRRGLVLLIVGTIVVLVWADLVLDAGLIKIGTIHPLTNFFTH